MRLQCYEGLDESKALYEWNYQKQLLAIQMNQGSQSQSVKDLFGEESLLERVATDRSWIVQTYLKSEKGTTERLRARRVPGGVPVYTHTLKRRLTAMKVANSVLSGSASWASPMEIEQAVADMTDSYTVRVARFKQDKAEERKCLGHGSADEEVAHKLALHLGLTSGRNAQAVRGDADAGARADGGETIADDLHRSERQSDIHNYLLC